MTPEIVTRKWPFVVRPSTIIEGARRKLVYEVIDARTREIVDSFPYSYEAVAEATARNDKLQSG